MFFSQGFTANRALNALTGVIKIPYMVNGTVADQTGFGFDSAGSGDFTLSVEEGFYQIAVTSTGAGDKYRAIFTSKLIDLTAIDRLYITSACVAGSVGSKYFTTGVVKSGYENLNIDPDITLLVAAGASNVSIITARTSTHAIETKVLDVSSLEGYYKIFMELYATDAAGADTSTLKMYNVVMEA